MAAACGRSMASSVAAVRSILSKGMMRSSPSFCGQRWTSSLSSSSIVARRPSVGDAGRNFAAAGRAARTPAALSCFPTSSSLHNCLSGSAAAVMRLGAMSPLVNSSVLVFGKGAGVRAFSQEASEGKVGLSLKRSKRHNNLYDILSMLDNYGLGWRVTRNNWQRRYPESYWIITRVKLTGKKRRAWGKKIWKGVPQYEGKEILVRGDHKREWRYMVPDPDHFSSPEALKKALASAPAPFYVVPDPNPPKNAEGEEQSADA